MTRSVSLRDWLDEFAEAKQLEEEYAGEFAFVTARAFGDFMRLSFPLFSPSQGL